VERASWVRNTLFPMRRTTTAPPVRSRPRMMAPTSSLAVTTRAMKAIRNREATQAPKPVRMRTNQGVPVVTS
jgi:hypothetical protein